MLKLPLKSMPITSDLLLDETGSTLMLSTMLLVPLIWFLSRYS
jgi:hypothetical protein